MPTAPQNTDELYQALQANDERPYGRTRTVTAEELVDAAEQFEEPVPLIHALLELQEAYTYGSEPRKSPVVFARLLNLFDEQPDLFDERLRYMLFWRFKWVSNALRQLPEIPLTGLNQWLTEMRERYEKAGLGLQPYYGEAYQLAAHTGEDTTLAYELWAARTRTRFSDCEACEICRRACHHLTAGDDERALAVWEPVLAGKESCQEEPARSVSYALLPLLRTGRVERARELHLAGYRGCRRNPSMAGEVGRHLEFCALTGNEARGLELLAENRNLFDEVDSPLEQLDFLTGVEVLLQRVESLGHGELPAAGHPGRTWTVSGLRAEVRTRADDLAARFDTRNGTTTVTDRRRARLDRAPLLDALELTLRTRSLDDVAPAAPAAAPAPRAAEAVPESLSELILRARALDEKGHPDTRACWTRLRTLVAAPDYTHPDDPAVGPLVLLRADLLSDEASQAGEKDDHAEAAALHEEAAALYEDAGEPGHAAVERGTALLAEAERAEGAEAKAAVLTDAHATMVRLHESTTGLPLTRRPACCACAPPCSACASSGRGARSTSRRSSPSWTCCTPSPPGTTSPGRSPAACCCAPPPMPWRATCPPRSPRSTPCSNGSGPRAPTGTCPGRWDCAAVSSSGSRTPRPHTPTSPRRSACPVSGRATRSTPPVSSPTSPRPVCTSAAPTRHCGT
ncbi:hypothetical protein SGRIM119S_06332 [Streptomyces griseorubiginosus]